MRKKLFDIINGKFIIEKTNQENIEETKSKQSLRTIQSKTNQENTG